MSETANIAFVLLLLSAVMLMVHGSPPASDRKFVLNEEGKILTEEFKEENRGEIIRGNKVNNKILDGILNRVEVDGSNDEGELETTDRQVPEPVEDLEPTGIEVLEPTREEVLGVENPVLEGTASVLVMVPVQNMESEKGVSCSSDPSINYLRSGDVVALSIKPELMDGPCWWHFESNTSGSLRLTCEDMILSGAADEEYDYQMITSEQLQAMRDSSEGEGENKEGEEESTTEVDENNNDIDLTTEIPESEVDSVTQQTILLEDISTSTESSDDEANESVKVKRDVETNDDGLDMTEGQVAGTQGDPITELQEELLVLESSSGAYRTRDCSKQNHLVITNESGNKHKVCGLFQDFQATSSDGAMNLKLVLKDGALTAMGEFEMANCSVHHL